jgi:hypothetical protein
MHYCKNIGLLERVCYQVTEHARATPTLAEIKGIYREYENKDNNDFLKEAQKHFEPTASDTEAKKNFLKIQKQLSEGKKYNQIIYDLGLDKSWYDPTLKPPTGVKKAEFEPMMAVRRAG